MRILQSRCKYIQQSSEELGHNKVHKTVPVCRWGWRYKTESHRITVYGWSLPLPSRVLYFCHKMMRASQFVSTTSILVVVIIPGNCNNPDERSIWQRKYYKICTTHLSAYQPPASIPIWSGVLGTKPAVATPLSCLVPVLEFSVWIKYDPRTGRRTPLLL